MFQLSVLKDTIPVLPAAFGIPADQAVLKELNKKYANRIVHDLGLAICVFDMVKIGDGIVHFGDGCLWYKVTFRLVVFRPFASEIILAKVKSSSEDGIRLTIEFFDDMLIPPSYLPAGSAFDPNEQLFFWHPDSDAEVTTLELLDTPITERSYIDIGEYMRVRVESDEFHDDEPGPPKAVQGLSIIPTKRPPYTITCSIGEQGLGLLSWWSGGDGEEGEEEGEAE